MKKLLYAIVLLACSLTINAQQGLELGGGVGISHYFGDLNTSFRIQDPGLSAYIAGRYNFNKRLAIKFSANYGNVSADDANSENTYERARNLSFRSIILDGTAQFEFNFLPYTHGSKDEFFTPYLFAGLSIFYFNPQTEYQGEWVNLRPLGTEGQFLGEEYYTAQGALAFGGGIKFDLNYEWSINIELSARHLFTDYLDDVSTVYTDKDDLENLRGTNGELAAALSDRSIPIPGVSDSQIGLPGRQRGNSNDNDKVVFLSVGILYYFGDIRCPTYSR